ncbi:MAG: hypothetical protein ACREGR_01210 [Minisyncoccia bacterium]
MKAFDRRQLDLVEKLVAAPRDILADIVVSAGYKEKIDNVNKAAMIGMILKYAGDEDVPDNRDCGQPLTRTLRIRGVQAKLLHYRLVQSHDVPADVVESVK